MLHANVSYEPKTSPEFSTSDVENSKGKIMYDVTSCIWILNAKYFPIGLSNSNRTEHNLNMENEARTKGRSDKEGIERIYRFISDVSRIQSVFQCLYFFLHFFRFYIYNQTYQIDFGFFSFSIFDMAYEANEYLLSDDTILYFYFIFDGFRFDNEIT